MAECYRYWPLTDAEAVWVDQATTGHGNTKMFTINFLPTEKIAADKKHSEREREREKWGGQ